MPSLPTELWMSIIDTLDKRNTSSFAGLARASRSLSALATPLLYHTVCFRHSSHVETFSHTLIARPYLIEHIRIVVFLRGVDIPQHQYIFAACKRLIGVHVRDMHLPGSRHLPAPVGVRTSISKPNPRVNSLLVTFERKAHRTFTNFDGLVPATTLPPRTLHLDRIERADTTSICLSALPALRRISAMVCMGQGPMIRTCHEGIKVSQGSSVALDMFVVQVYWYLGHSLERVRIFVSCKALADALYEALMSNGTTFMLDDERLEVVIHNFGPGGYAKAVYAEMCGDGSLWRTGTRYRGRYAGP